MVDDLSKIVHRRIDVVDVHEELHIYKIAQVDFLEIVDQGTVEEAIPKFISDDLLDLSVWTINHRSTFY